MPSGEVYEFGPFTLNTPERQLSKNGQVITLAPKSHEVLLALVRWLYISRGTIRLDGSDTLHAPGHPAVPVSTITEINDDLWERKGISYISYEGAEGTAGEIKLDDFVYERKPIDQIHDRLRHLNPTRQTD